MMHSDNESSGLSRIDAILEALLKVDRSYVDA